MSQSQEIIIGKEQYLLMQQADGGAYVADPALTAYIQKVGYKLSSVSDRDKLPYEFVVIDNQIPNAWALPGGKIAINRGLLTELKSEAELAAVLSHEIVHSAARHSAKSIERSIFMQMGLYGMQEILKNRPYEPLATATGLLSSSLLQLKYSREAELEADCYGIKYMTAAGYDPKAAIELQKTFLRLSEGKRPHWLIGLFATHPPSQKRLEANEKTAALYTSDAPLIDGREEYQKTIAELHKLKKADEALQKGYEALSQGKPQEALSLAEKSLALFPQHAHLHNLAGKAKRQLHDPKGALAYFQKACDLNPAYFEFYLGLGLSEHDLQLKEAKQHLEKSLSLFPTADAYATLGVIYLDAGNTSQALSHLQMASQSDSVAGKKAQSLFNKLDLTVHPEHYIVLSPIWNKANNLSLHLKNTSTSSVHDILVDMTFKDSDQTITTRSICIPTVIASGTERILTTNVSKDPSLSLQTLKITHLEIYNHENF